ncbi:MAG: glycosyltransferase, partial [Candidatus Electrothrix sp. ATG1]|nr:glycosyltransferase [Candidatus Electrothrix sp. ATG1]
VFGVFGWFWQETDLLLMPSLHEGAPNAVLEALATETPVLASDIPEHQEILPQECLLSLTDAGAWQEKLEAITENPQYQLNQLVAAQERTCDHLRFDWDEKIACCILGF